MRTRLYIVAGLFIASLIIASFPAFTSEKIIDVHYSQLTPAAKKQVDCLAENIYFEAGYEPADGKKAVALVTMNRTQDERFPKDICSVVKQKVNSTCQFSWYCEGKKQIANYYAYNEAKKVALLVYANYENLRDITNGALYYHADYVNPRWKLEKTVVIGRHIFYKEKGGI
jgi:spore germination cell wall hydrolase CwlJ-like protein